MMFVLGLSLGFILSSSPGPASSVSQPERPQRAHFPAWIVVAQFHTATDHDRPSSPSRGELTEADSEEEDELLAFRLVPSSVVGSVIEVDRPALPTMTHTTIDGLLHRLHRSWPLVC